MKRPPANKRDLRKARFAEFEERIHASALEAYLAAANDQQFTSASDVVESFCFRECYEMGLEFVRVTYSPTHLYVMDSRHGGAVFYVATPEYLRDFQREVLRALPSPSNSRRRYECAGLLQALRAALRLPGKRGAA